MGTCGTFAFRAIARLGLVVALTALTGCATFSPTVNAGGGARSGPKSPAFQHPLLQGIPLPGGFELLDKESVHSSSGATRVAKCVFKGKLRPAETARFYKDQMPAGGFTLRGESFDQGVYDQRYESEREECNVRIGRHAMHTRLTLDVRPKPVGVPEGGGKRPGQNPPTP